MSDERMRQPLVAVLCTVPLTFTQAALGAEVEVPTLDGKGKLRVPAGTQAGTTLRIKGKGMHNQPTITCTSPPQVSTAGELGGIPGVNDSDLIEFDFSAQVVLKP